jgi:site-specific DNA-methyltransferase (adenine-specific)
MIDQMEKAKTLKRRNFLANEGATMKKITIGNATLYCGDCFDVLPRLNMKFDAVISDPPFGMTACDWDVAFPLDQFWGMLEGKTKPAANFVLFGCGKFTIDLVNSNRKWYRYDLIWKKNNKAGFLLANKMPLRNHESILVFGRPGSRHAATYNPQKSPGGRRGIITNKLRGGVYSKVGSYTGVYDGTLHPCSVLPFDSDKDRRQGLHPTIKPLELMEFLVKSYSNEGDIIIDPFMGSGTTGVAAVQSGRTFIGIEQEKNYFDIACKRIKQAFATGKEIR